MADIRLVVCDMDGTLLLDDGSVPDEFWPLLERAAELGVEFVPASGRQLATLLRIFGDAPGGRGLSYIAENGTVVTHGDDVVSTTTVADDSARRVVRAVRAAAEEGINLGVVVCRASGAVIERGDAPFVAECSKYYVELDVVDDLLVHCHDVVKLAVFDFGDAASTATSHFADLEDQVVVSGKHWIDVMSHAADKGVGVRALQQILGITREETAAFGDYLNDVEMLAAAKWSYAVANAHPTVAEIAAHRIPSNTDLGVIVTMRDILDNRRR